MHYCIYVLFTVELCLLIWQEANRPKRLNKILIQYNITYDNDNENDFISNNNSIQTFLFTQFGKYGKQEVIDLFKCFPY